MTKCETRKQLSYSRLGTGISQENGGSNPPTCMAVVNIDKCGWGGGGGGAWGLNVTSRENPVVK